MKKKTLIFLFCGLVSPLVCFGNGVLIINKISAASKLTVAYRFLMPSLHGSLLEPIGEWVIIKEKRVVIEFPLDDIFFELCCGEELNVTSSAEGNNQTFVVSEEAGAGVIKRLLKV